MYFMQFIYSLASFTIVLATGGKHWEWQKLGLHAIYYVSC